MVGHAWPKGKLEFWCKMGAANLGGNLPLCKHKLVKWNICHNLFSLAVWATPRTCVHFLFCLPAGTLTDSQRVMTPRLFWRKSRFNKSSTSGWKAACRDCGRPGGGSPGPLPQGHPQVEKRKQSFSVNIYWLFQKHKTLQRLPFEGRGCGRKKKWWVEPSNYVHKHFAWLLFSYWCSSCICSKI